VISSFLHPKTLFGIDRNVESLEEVIHDGGSLLKLSSVTAFEKDIVNIDPEADEGAALRKGEEKGEEEKVELSG
jgi:hypothetical protein